MESTQTQPTIVPNKNPKATGFYDDINETQFNILQKFKEKIANDNLEENMQRYTEVYLLSFCRARKFDLDKVFLMFSNFIKWRKENNVNEIESYDFHEIMEVKKIYPHSYHKTDKFGHPIYIEIMSKVDLTQLFKITTEERMMKYYIKEYERTNIYRFPSCAKSFNKVIEQSIVILDMEGIGLSILTGKVKEFLKIASNLAQDYYPETLHKMFLINTSFFFSAVWTIVKGFIDEKTRNKINVEKSSYQKKLLEFVDEENLPVFLGGKCTCSHIEGGCMYSDIGPWNPNGGLRSNYRD